MAPTEIYTLSLHDALPILDTFLYGVYGTGNLADGHYEMVQLAATWGFKTPNPKENYISKVNSIEGIMEFIQDRKSTRLNSSHVKISYAVFCLKKKKKTKT